MKYTQSLSLIGLLVLSACSSSTLPGDATDGAGESSSSVLVESSSSETSSDAASSVGETTGEPRVIKINASNWEFGPNSITVKKGEKVTLEITSAEGIHGFSVRDLGINVQVKPGEMVTVELPTDTAGTFEFFCSVPCGPGHKEMRGTIIIEE